MHARVGIAVVVCALAVAVSVTAAIANSQEFVHLTLQGRLSDLVGTALPDGTHNIEISIQDQAGALPWFVATTVETKDGLFSVTLANVPIFAFECDDADNPCAQNVSVRVVDDNVTLPWISLGQTGRAGVSARINGDVESSPSRIDFPVANVLEPQTAFMSNAGVEFIGTNGQPTLKFDNLLVPGHQLPTLVIADPTLTTFGGPTSVLHSFTVNVGQDATPDFSVDNINGVYSKDQIISFNPTPTARLEMSFDGDISLNSYSSGVQDLADLELLNGGGATMRSTSVAFDRNNDNSPDVHFQTDGTCTFNSDLTGGADVTFGSTNCTIAKPFRCDPDGDGSIQYAYEASECRFNPDEDAHAEFICDGGTVTVQAGFIVDNNPNVFGETFVAGTSTVYADANMDGTRELKVDANKVAMNGVVEAKFDPAATGRSFSIEENRTRVDVNQDGTYEIEVGLSDVTNEVYVDVQSEFSVRDQAFLLGGMRLEGGMEAFGDATFNSPVVINSSLEVNTAGGVVINGDLTVTGTKNFAQAHPTDPTKEIIYTALEAGESGTYTRGSARLADGVAVIDLPEHFALVTNEDGLTAQITPRGPVQSMLYVESVSPTHLIVRASSPADSNVRFDYMVNGVRAGFEEHQVIRDKRSVASR